MRHNPDRDRSKLKDSTGHNIEPDVSEFPQDVAAAWANVILDLYERGVRKSVNGMSKQEPPQECKKAA